MSENKSVIVCGGGIMGLCCAYYLARDGADVTIVERNGEDRDHCALGSAGYVSPSHVIPLAAPGMVWQGFKWMFNPRSPFHVKPRLEAEFIRWSWLFWRACTPAHTRRSAPVLADLCLQSRELFVEFDNLTGGAAFDFEKKGLINLCRSSESVQKETQGLGRIANEVGVEARTIGMDEVRALNPGMKIEAAGGVFFPIDAHVTPGRHAAALLAQLKVMDVKFRWNTAVTGWRTDGDRIAAVRTAEGELTADEYVLAGGSWSPGLLAGLGVRMPVQAGKGYSLTLPKPPVRATVPMILKESRIAITPMGAAMRFGGTMELSGVNHAIRPERVAQIVESVPQWLPDYRAEHFAGIEPWCGLRPVSPDGMPYIGRFRRHRNLTAATGHAMLGLTLAPITGRLVSEVVHDRKPGVDLTTLDPDRYA